MGRYLIVGFIGMFGFILGIVSLATWGLSSVLESHREELTVTHIKEDISFFVDKSRPSNNGLGFTSMVDEISLLKDIQVNDSMSIEDLAGIQLTIARVAQNEVKSSLEKFEYALNHRQSYAAKIALDVFLKSIQITNRPTLTYFTTKEKQLLKELKALNSSDFKKHKNIKKLHSLSPQLEHIVQKINQQLLIAKA